MSLEALEGVLLARERLRVEMPGFAESAVLITLRVDQDASLGDSRLIFTVRTADMRTHAGQISFPGGRRDPCDPDLVATALREADEELRVPRERVEVVGLLDDVPTPSGYVITPVVGVVRGALELAPHAGEVAAVFECSLDELRAPARYHDAGEVAWHGVVYRLHEYHVDGRRIWGATARIVHQLLELTGPRQ